MDVADAIKWYLVFLFSTCVHEAAHAWTALRLGDDTAAKGGQVSLDPVPHIRREPFGMVVVPLLSFALGGWMVGWASTPYDPQWARTYPRRAAWMALAGPAANFALVLAAALFIRIGFEWQVFEPSTRGGFLHVVAGVGPMDGGWAFCAKMLSLTFSLNLLLAAFNLLPVPPLDGSSLPLLMLGDDLAEKYMGLLRQPAFAMFGLVVAWNGFGEVFPGIFRYATAALGRLLAGA
jgi:Zn-dependent protease